MSSDTTGEDDDVEVGGGAPGDGKLEQGIQSAGGGAEESTMKGESIKSGNRSLYDSHEAQFVNEILANHVALAVVIDLPHQGEVFTRKNNWLELPTAKYCL